MAIEITWGIIALAIGAILGAIGILGVKQRQTRMTLGWIAAVGIVVGILGISGAIPQLNISPFAAGGFLAAGGAPQQTQTDNSIQTSGSGTICAVEDTTVTLSAQDKYLGAVVGGSHRYRTNGAPALTVADAGTFTASPGDKLSVLWRNASTTGAYSSINEYTVPCKGTYTAGEDNGGAKLLSQNGSLTVTVFQDPGGLAISTAFTGGTNQTLAAGDIKNLKTLIQGQYQRDFPYGLTAVFEYNKTSMDDVIIQAGGIELPLTSVPMSYTPAGWATEGVRKAYLIPATLSNAEYQYTIVVDADDTNNPASRGSDINMTFYPLNNYIDDKKGGAYAEPASEDEYNVLTRGGIGITQTIFVD